MQHFTMQDYSTVRLKRLRSRLYSFLRVVCPQLQPYYPACITLTYAPNVDWSPRDISRFVNTLRRYYQRRGWRFTYFWVAELQQRGAVHFHLIVFIPPLHKLPKPDDAGWWRHGFTNIRAVRQFVSYFSKYLQKGIQDGLRFPKGLRLFGYGGLEYLVLCMWRNHWLPKWIFDFIYTRLGAFFTAKITYRYIWVFTANDCHLFVRRSPPDEPLLITFRSLL